MSTHYTTLNSALETVVRRLKGINHDLYQAAQDAYNSQSLNITYLAAKTLTLHPETGTYTIKDTSNAELEEIATNAINGEVETDYHDHDPLEYYAGIGGWEIDEGLATELTHVDSFLDWPSRTKATINVDIAASYNDTMAELAQLPVISEGQVAERTRLTYHTNKFPCITFEQRLVARDTEETDYPKPLSEQLEWQELPQYHDLVANIDTEWQLNTDEPKRLQDAVRDKVLHDLAYEYPGYKDFFLEDMTNIEVIID